LPGVDPDKDVDISVSDGVLHIEARREESKKDKDKDKRAYRSEFRYGTFSRDLALPKGVESKEVKASYRDGILEVRIPWPVAKPEAPERVAISRT
ncbi:MAG TPA: Hsp20/alpha crystallin family protein, partial [Acidimicrobiales bacterium]|nr:Hsp20/alpha crystallin family protein [Acidimicrobiales bacterium]